MLHYESTPNVKTEALINVFKNLTAVYGFAAEVGLIRDAVLEAKEGHGQMVKKFSRLWRFRQSARMATI